MRELYIGGCAQGKLAYVCREKKEENVLLKVVDCGMWKTPECLELVRKSMQDMAESMLSETVSGEKRPVWVFYHFQQWVRNLFQSGEQDAETKVWKAFVSFLDQCPEWILISDEVGNGIVPMEQVDRAYRECLGRMLIEAAARADRVERVICGLGQRIK